MEAPGTGAGADPVRSDADGAPLRVYDCEGRRRVDADPSAIRPYDFRNPVFLPEAELRQIRLRHEDLARHVSARLSIFLRRDFTATSGGLESRTYSLFTESIPDPSLLVLFKIEPLFGIGVIEIDPGLALQIADRMLGGRSEPVENNGYLTEIETNLVEDVVDVILEEWCRQWKNERELRHSLIGRETNGRFLQTSPANAVVLVAELQSKMGGCEGNVRISIPYYTLEPVIKEMQAGRQKNTSGLALEGKTEWRSSYNQIPVDLIAEWEADTMTVAEVLALKPGAVVELPRGIINQTQLRMENLVRFVGEAGLENGFVAVRIRETKEGERT